MPGAGNKRVGSGRLLARQENRDRDQEDRGDRGGFRRGDEFKRFPDSRRQDSGQESKFGSGFRSNRDRDEDGGWGDDRRRDGYFGYDDRRDGRRNEERRPQRRRNEPEWMNETISHNDVIELRGFDDKPSKKKETSPPGSGPGTLPLSLSLGLGKAGQDGGPPPGLPASGISVEDLERDRQPPKHRERRDAANNDQNQNVIEARKEAAETQPNILNDLGIVPKMNDDHYNFDKIMESMLGGAPDAGMNLPQDTNMAPKSAPKSRFSQFFNKGGAEDQVKLQDSRRSSIQDELLGANILKEINGEPGPLIKIPSPTETQDERYFAPISPAAQTRAQHNPLMEMINKGAAPPPGAMPGPPRVQDLEDNLRRQLGLGGGPPQPHPGAMLHHQPQNIQDFLKAAQGLNGQPPNMPGQPPHMMGRPQPQDAENMSAFKKLVSFSRLLCVYICLSVYTWCTSVYQQNLSVLITIYNCVEKCWEVI